MDDCKEYLPHFLHLISEFTFPYLYIKHDYRYLKVTLRGRQGVDSWAILDSPYCYNRVTGEWEYEMRVSERPDEWITQTRMPLEEALPLAKKLAAERKVHTLNQISSMLDRHVRYYEERMQGLTEGELRQAAEEDLAQALKHQSDWRIERMALEED